jgi:hypothetical protein
MHSPFRFVSVLIDFIRSTKAADVDAVTVADELRDCATPTAKTVRPSAAWTEHTVRRCPAGRA